jgi:cytoplasmic iron level regulating protein YaaA (DUF328/UPF0246 family)
MLAILSPAKTLDYASSAPPPSGQPPTLRGGSNVCEHRLSDAQALKGFDSDGYLYDPDNSDRRRWRFARS